MLFGAVFVEFIQISWGPAMLEQISRIHHINTRAPGSGLVVYGAVLLAVLYVPLPGLRGVLSARVLLFRPLASYSRAASAVPPGHSAQGEEDA